MSLKLRVWQLPILLLFNCHLCWSQASDFGVSLSGLEWGNTTAPTSAELTYYAGKGLKFIRLPFLWEKAQPMIGQPLNTAYMTTIDNLVSAANTAGVSIMLDMHNYCRYGSGGNPSNGTIINSSGGPTIAQFAHVWKLLAARYVNQPAIWGYDLMNEPHDLGTGNHWFPMAQAAIDSIRKVDTKHVIVVEGENWASANAWTQTNDIAANKMSALVDPNKNLVFEAHQYFDSDRSGTYANTTFSGNNATVTTGVTLVTPFVNWLKANNLKGMVGEYGIPNNNTTDQSNWNSLLDNLLTYLQNNCVMGVYWAGGSGWTWKSSQLVIEPANGTDAPQMAIVQKYNSFSSSCKTVTGLPSDNLLVDATCYPNPFADEFTLEISGPFDYVLFDVRGEEWMQGEGIDKVQVKTSSLAKGIYILKVKQNQRVKVVKVNKY